jgi:hypothetical protein
MSWAKDSYTALTREAREIPYTCSSCIVLHCGYDEQRYPFLRPTVFYYDVYSALVRRLVFWVSEGRNEPARAKNI